MGQERVTTSLTSAVTEEIAASLAPVDADLERRYPGDPGTRQPVHTVYVPADAFAAVLGLDETLADDVYGRVRAKLEREPVEDLRVDFEDGYGTRGDAEEDADAARAARLIAEAYDAGTAAPYMGIRMKCLEAAVRERGIRTLDVFLTGLAQAGRCLLYTSPSPRD